MLANRQQPLNIVKFVTPFLMFSNALYRQDFVSEQNIRNMPYIPKGEGVDSHINAGGLPYLLGVKWVDWCCLKGVFFLKSLHYHRVRNCDQLVANASEN